MINQEKVLRMTKMASYEEHGGRKDRAVVGYFRSDYIGKQTIISLIVITIRYAKAKKRLQLFLEYLDCLDQDGEEETAERK